MVRIACPALREAPWLTRERATIYARVLFGATLLSVAVWVALAQGGRDAMGRPLGTDFISFWTASELALAGRAATVYDVVAHHAAEIALFPGEGTGYTAFFYPPPFLLVCLPLALLPYAWSLLAWLGITGALCWQALRRLLPRGGMIIPMLAFPAVLQTLGHGQNAFLTTALFATAARLLGARPVLAGMCLGGLVIKPHLAVLVPLALLAGRRWRVLTATAATALVLLAVSWAAFGTATWQAFLAVTPLARAALEADLVGPAKMVSVFAALRLVRADIVMAYGGQLAVTAVVCAVLVRAIARRPGAMAEVVLLIAAVPLASPFLLDYDLMLIAVPLAWVVGEALRTGFLPWEKLVLAAAFVLPLVSRNVAMHVGLSPAVPVLLALFAIVVRRAGWQTSRVAL